MGVLIQIDRFNSKNIYQACHSLLKVLSMKKMKYIRELGGKVSITGNETRKIFAKCEKYFPSPM